MCLKSNCNHKLCTYLRQSTTLMGISCFIGACVGKMLDVLSDDQAIALMTASIPLWINEQSKQVKTEMIAAEIIHNLPDLQKGAIDVQKNLTNTD